MTTQYPLGKKLYIISTIILLIGGIVSYDLMVIIDPRNFSTLGEISVTAIFGSVIIIPVLASIIGVFIALMPYQSLTFKQKYFRSYLLALLSLNSIYFVVCIYAAIRNAMHL